jgi:putative sigma-54 modulation protein
MSVIVSIRNGNISNTLKVYAENKAAAIIDDYPKITSVRVILDCQKSRHKAEILVRGKNLNIEADYESFDMYDSIDAVIEKTNTQLRRHLDKVQDHYKPSKLHPIVEEETEEEAEEKRLENI